MMGTRLEVGPESLARVTSLRLGIDMLLLAGAIAGPDIRKFFWDLQLCPAVPAMVRSRTYSLYAIGPLFRPKGVFDLLQPPPANCGSSPGS
jgi:hypothetical protein